MSRRDLLAPFLLVTTAACGRTSLDVEELEAPSSTATTPPPPPPPPPGCNDLRRDRLVFDAWPRARPFVHAISPTDDGAFYVTGSGIDTCSQGQTTGDGFGFVARHDADRRTVWTHRMKDSAAHVTPAADGGLYVLVNQGEALFPDATPGMAIAHFDADGRLQATHVPHLSDGEGLCASREVVLAISTCGGGSARGGGDPICGTTDTSALVWLDATPEVIEFEPLLGPDGGAVTALACAFDGDEAILVGRGTGVVELGGGAIDLGERASFVARLSKDRTLVAQAIYPGSLTNPRARVDAASRDLVVDGGYSAGFDLGTGTLPGPGNVSAFVARFAPDLSPRWAWGVACEANVQSHGSDPDGHGGAVWTFRHPAPATAAGRTFTSLFTVLGLDDRGEIRWQIDEAARVRVALELADGTRIVGGNYEPGEPPTTLSGWPTAGVDGTGFVAFVDP